MLWAVLISIVTKYCIYKIRVVELNSENAYEWIKKKKKNTVISI